MVSLGWIRRIVSPEGPVLPRGGVILPVDEQRDAWRAANDRMKWGISDAELDDVGAPPPHGAGEAEMGLTGVALFYGFGDDGRGNADPVLSGMLPWRYARKLRGRKGLWQSPYVNFGRADSFRLRPGAPPRPRGFYFAWVQLGQRLRRSTVATARRGFGPAATGWGPEGFQFLCVTHPHAPETLNGREAPFMALADYDVAPYGFSDFFDAPQLFCGGGVLGLGIGNVEEDYAGFGVPTLRLCPRR